MAKLEKLIASMRNNLRGDWRIGQLKSIADHLGIPYRQPGTSHVTFAPTDRPGLTVPAHKPIYVRRFLAMIETKEGDDGDQA